MVNNDLKGHYEAVLHDLEGERAEVYQQVTGLQGRLKELDFNIASLSRRVNPTPPTIGPPAQPVSSGLDQKYAFISVRWAILDLLNDATGPMTTSDIADALRTGGVKTKAANFVNNVSAVLSTTLKGQSEVELVDGKWRLTDKGRSAIYHIRNSSKFRRSCPWIGAPGAGTPGLHLTKGGDPL